MTVPVIRCLEKISKNKFIYVTRPKFKPLLKSLNVNIELDLKAQRFFWFISSF